MARRQGLISLQLTGVTTTAVPLSATAVQATSVLIQNPLSSADDIIVGNAAGQYQHIYPGKDLEIRGDNLDHGTSAWLDLSTIYVKFQSGTGTVVYSYLDSWGAVGNGI